MLKKKLPTAFVIVALCAAAFNLHGETKEFAGFTGKGDYEAYCKAEELVIAGVALMNANKNDDAIQKFKAALAVYPEHAQAHDNLGIIYRRKKQLALAETECKQAVELDKKSWRAWRNLATIYYDQKKYSEAIAAYQTCLGNNPPAAKAAVIKQDLQYIVDLQKRSSAPK